MNEAPPTLDFRLLQLAPPDNVAVARERIKAGSRLVIGERTVDLAGDCDVGFKVACRPIARGEAVIRYGAPIGSATDDIAPGEIVHLHNLKSDYLPTYHHGHQSAEGEAT